METERLYHHDPTLRSFRARILDTWDDDEGHGLVLDRTAFYPTSGGQPHDTGTVNEIAVSGS